jgi:hypothetical protein
MDRDAFIYYFIYLTRQRRIKNESLYCDSSASTSYLIVLVLIPDRTVVHVDRLELVRFWSLVRLYQLYINSIGKGTSKVDTNK